MNCICNSSRKNVEIKLTHSASKEAFWRASQLKSYSVHARVDQENRIEESNEENNQYSQQLLVTAVPVPVLPLSNKKELKPMTELSSPDGKLKIFINTKGDLAYSVYYEGKQIIKPSAVGMELMDGRTLGKDAKLLKSVTRFVDITENPVVNIRSKTLKNVYKEISLKFEGNFSYVFRAWNDGLAFRLETSLPDSIEIKDENGFNKLSWRIFNLVSRRTRIF
ncbi:MAG: hypothetical protein HC906_15030 [Bacteroidales bacterium]|nr:hypothetical protein [Bacteroidales bacterium]